MYVCVFCFQNYIIPPGDMLMLSPYWAHRNPKYFPDPEDFKPVSYFTFLNDLMPQDEVNPNSTINQNKIDIRHMLIKCFSPSK